jgi:hypothetical protein
MALITLQTMIDKAARRCGHVPEILTTEQTQALRENLFLIFAHNANKGLQLWKVDKYRHGIINGQVAYTLPDRAERILNVNYVTSNQVEFTQTAPLNWPTASPGQVSAVGVKLAVGTTGVMRLEYSVDNTNWVTSSTLTTATGWNYVSVPIQNTSYYWRVAYYTLFGTSLAATAFPTGSTVLMLNNLSEIPMAPLNRDDYWNLPNKEFQSNRPLQYWFDRQNTMNPIGGSYGPQVRYWPVGNDETVHVNMLISSRINDATSLAYDQQVDVPERWLPYIQARFAADSAIELPNVDSGKATLLMSIADKMEMEVSDEETDDMPIYLAPNISHYTR